MLIAKHSQLVVAIGTTTNNNKRPSASLEEKIRNCVSVFRSLDETVNVVIELGQKEGFNPKQIGQFIRQKK